MQREGLDYEFTVVMDLSVDGHVASSTKDRTGLYDGCCFTPNEATGRELLASLNQGDDPVQNAVRRIDTMLAKLDLSTLRDNYWLYALNRCQAASVDLLTEQQFQEQVALLLIVFGIVDRRTSEGAWRTGEKHCETCQKNRFHSPHSNLLSSNSGCSSPVVERIPYVGIEGKKRQPSIRAKPKRYSVLKEPTALKRHRKAV